MFSVFPSSPLSRRFSIILILAGPTSNMMAYLVCFQEHESTASVRPVSSFNESAELTTIINLIGTSNFPTTHDKTCPKSVSSITNMLITDDDIDFGQVNCKMQILIFH